jgi:hypothetical protein
MRRKVIRQGLAEVPMRVQTEAPQREMHDI